MSDNQEEIVLYTYFRSSCSARLRIALLHKSLPFTSKYVNIKDNHHHETAYTSINPSVTVPTLLIPSSDVAITQSLAALEYLDEAFPSTPSLLPQDPAKRATARALAQIIAGDIQPPTNMRVLQRVSALGGDATEWVRDIAGKGLKAYEALASKSAGKFSVGDELTIADVCLVPAVWNAERYGVDLSGMPTVRRVYEEASKVPAVRGAHWKVQEDCPESLRGEGVQ